MHIASVMAMDLRSKGLPQRYSNEPPEETVERLRKVLASERVTRQEELEIQLTLQLKESQARNISKKDAGGLRRNKRVRFGQFKKRVPGATLE